MIGKRKGGKKMIIKRRVNTTFSDFFFQCKPKLEDTYKMTSLCLTNTLPKMAAKIQITEKKKENVKVPKELYQKDLYQKIDCCFGIIVLNWVFFYIINLIMV